VEGLIYSLRAVKVCLWVILELSRLRPVNNGLYIHL
jgi:hypothetical protein